jgi:3-oxoadipate enol-lactonase
MNSLAEFVRVDGGELYVEQAGSGQPVLLLHAGVTDRRVWDLAVPPLAQRYRVIRYDGRGYGRSPAPAGPFSLVSDALAVLDHYGLPDAHFVGLSQGAATSVDVALAHPGRVRSLTLVAPGLSGFDWPQLPGYAERVAAAERDDATALAAAICRLWAPLSGAPGDDLASRMIMDNAGVFLADELEVDEPPAVDRLDRIGVPTLVVLGDRDLDVITEIGDLLAAGIPGARRVMLAGADHMLPLRVPDRLHAVLVDHLARVP